MTTLFIAFDPGQTTGVYTVEVDGGEITDHGGVQYERWEAVESVRDMICYTWADPIVIGERYNVFQKQASKTRKDIEWPLDVYSCLKFVAYEARAPFVQRWNYHKNTVSDEDLDALGFLSKPKVQMRHANDAARHIVSWAVMVHSQGYKNLEMNDEQLKDIRHLGHSVSAGLQRGPEGA